MARQPRRGNRVRHQRAFFGGDSVLKKLSEETGGRVIEVKANRDVSRAFQEIAEELRTQYLQAELSTADRARARPSKFSVYST